MPRKTVRRIAVSFLALLFLFPANLIEATGSQISSKEEVLDLSFEIESKALNQHLEEVSLSLQTEIPADILGLYIYAPETEEPLGLISEWTDAEAGTYELAWDLHISTLNDDGEAREETVILADGHYDIAVVVSESQENEEGEEEQVSTITHVEEIFVHSEAPIFEFDQDISEETIEVEDNVLSGRVLSYFSEIEKSEESLEATYTLEQEEEQYTEGKLGLTQVGEFNLTDTLQPGFSTLTLSVTDLAQNTHTETLSVNFIVEEEASENLIEKERQEKIEVEENEEITEEENQDSSTNTKESNGENNSDASPQIFSMQRAVPEGSVSFENGDSDPRVIDLKVDLGRLGFHVSNNPNENYGPATTRTVKEFQEYYGLDGTGVTDANTLATIEKVLSTPLRSGQNHAEAIPLKENLSTLGFHVSNNPNTAYGPSTERAVRDFQSDYGLAVNGIADAPTLAKIDELMNKPMERGLYRQDVVAMKLNLADLGFVVSANPTPQFGPSTERTVKEFQAYYGLPETGIVDGKTMGKIEETLSSPLRNGQNHAEAIPLKENLSTLGFHVSDNPNTAYGPSTERAVKGFQNYYGLIENGIADTRTLAKIQELLSSPLSNGRNHADTIPLKENLSTLGFHVSDNPNTAYGPATERAVREFQSYYGLTVNGIADSMTLAKIKEILASPLQNGKQHNDVIKLKTDLMHLGFGNFAYTNTSFGPSTEQTVREFQESNGLSVSGIADYITLAKIASEISENDNNEDFNGSSVIGYVKANSMNVRSTPNTLHDPIDSISNDTRVEILSTYSRVRENAWHHVRYDNNKTGYVSAGYIQLAIKQPSNSGALAGKTIILDAGHGAQDSGGIGGGMLEKNVVLDISLRAEELLRQEGAEVIMIRRTDLFLSLSQRSFLANRSDADVFVSVHTNIGGGKGFGTETFWHGRHESANSEKLAHALQDATVTKMGTNYRRVQEGNYSVIRETEIPSALLEVAFMDHSEDAAKLRQDSYRQRSAEGIRDGLINYFN